MNQCQSCHQRDAVVRLTEIVGTDVRTLHLCSQCAAERGIETDTNVNQTPLGAFLAAMGKGDAPASAGVADTAGCPACGATLADFRTSGRLGCPSCWTTFAPPMRELLRRLHGATRHTGEWYQCAAAATDDGRARVQRTRDELQRALHRAVEAEEFERAAELRDQIRVLERE